MATNVIMPALEMAQDKGKLLRWLKPEGAIVTKGEPIMEIETDKVTVEIEAPASGTLANITAREGDVVPVGQTIALILEAGESAPSILSGAQAKSKDAVNVSPVARRIAEEHGVDLAIIKPSGGKIEKADVLAFVNRRSLIPTFSLKRRRSNSRLTKSKTTWRRNAASILATLQRFGTGWRNHRGRIFQRPSAVVRPPSFASAPLGA